MKDFQDKGEVLILHREYPALQNMIFKDNFCCPGYLSGPQICTGIQIHRLSKIWIQSESGLKRLTIISLPVNIRHIERFEYHLI